MRRTLVGAMVVLGLVLLAGASGAIDAQPRARHALARVQHSDRVHFATHAVLGLTFNHLGIDPTFAAAEWLAAAAHVRTEPEWARTVDGLARARQQSADPEMLAANLCARGMGDRQRVALRQAGLACDAGAR